MNLTANRIFATALISITFALGFALARYKQKTPESLVATDSVPHLNSSLESDAAPRFNPRSWNTTKQTIIERWENSPSASVDYPLINLTHSQLNNVPTELLESWILELDAKTASVETDHFSYELIEVIAKVLLSRDPPRLFRFWEEKSKHSSYDVDYWIHLWINSDPTSALSWLQEGELPQSLKDDADFEITDAITNLAAADPTEFEKQLASVSQEMRADILFEYGYRRGTKLNRDTILDRATRSNHTEAMELWYGLILREAELDYENAISTLTQLDISPEDRKNLDLRLLRYLMPNHYDKNHEDKHSKLMLSWQERNREQTTPQEILDYLEAWTLHNEKEAVDWAKEKLLATHYDNFALFMIGRYADGINPNFSHLANITKMMHAPKIRNHAQTRLHMYWQPIDPSAAQKWLLSLPPEDQQAIQNSR